MHRFAIQSAFAVTLFGAMGLTISAQGSGDTFPVVSEAHQISVTPTIPQPVPPVGQHIRFHNLLPAQGKGEPEKGGNGHKRAAVVESGPEFSLGDCVAVAIERQPSLKAARASLTVAEDGYKSILNFGIAGTLISPDLTYRKQQAQRGVTAASAEYQRTYNEIVQDVTRMYYSAIYAKQAQATVDDLVGQIEVIVETIRSILEVEVNPKNLEGLNRGKLLLAEMGLLEAQGEQARARIGRQQALAALRQVMNVTEQSCPFQLKDKELPVMAQQVQITKELVVEQALCRRPELALAAAGVDVFRLEVYAQGMIRFKKVVPTFGSAADLHAKETPPANRGKEYRPGLVSPEMPSKLVGNKFDRVSRAITFSERADAVYESARSLVTLEAENTYFEFELASEKLRLSQEKYDKGLELRRYLIKSAPDIKAKDTIVAGMVIVARAQVDYIEAVYQYALALSALERVTAGAIRPAFPGR